MGREIISQILSPENATYIDGVAAQRLVSPAILENMFQGLVEKDGRGVDDKFVSETEANEAAQIFVHRILPVKMEPREQGASKNGASFSANSHYTQTVTVGIEILTTIDDPIIIPRARQDMIKVDLLSEQIKIYSDRLATIINGATVAAKLIACYLAENKGNEINTKALGVGGEKVTDGFMEANSLLDEGDTDNGIDIFPMDTRVAVFKMAYRPVLKAGGVLLLGGANYAYDIAKGSAISQGDKVRTGEDGFWGELDGVPCHGISNESLIHASRFLGLTSKDLKMSKWVGYISSSYANARGVSTAEQTKVVDAIAGQGLILQPYTKMGVVSWYPKGNVLLYSAENVVGFVKKLNEILTPANGAITFRLKGAGSRLYPTVTFSAKTNAAFTVAATALDDFAVPVDHVYETGIYVQKKVTTVSEFLEAYDDENVEHGTFTVGQSKSMTASLTAGGSVTALVISDDGSCTLASYDYAA